MRGWRLCTSPLHEGRRWLPVCFFRPRRWVNGEVRLQSECNGCHRKKQKARWRRLTRKQRERHNEDGRLYHAMERERRGVLGTNRKKNQDRVGQGGGRPKGSPGPGLDPEPLLRLIAQSGLPLRTIAERAGVTERRITSWRSGKYRPSLDAADKVCMALGENLAVLYPLDDDELEG